MESSIVVNDYIFRYQAIGSSAQPAILFLHGFMGNCHEFDTVMTQLSDSFYCVAVDLPGHGKTIVNGDRGYAMESTAHGLIQFLQALQLSSCCLVGYSMGGRLALFLALHYPDYFSQVILESASPGLRTQTERDRRQQQDQQLIADLLIAELERSSFVDFLHRWYEQPLFATIKNHPNFANLLQQRLDSSPIGLAQSLRGMGTGVQPTLWDMFSHNQIPLLLLVGASDRKFVAINTDMVNACQSAQLVTIADCGHNIHFENEPQFIRQVQKFLGVPPRLIDQMN